MKRKVLITVVLTTVLVFSFGFTKANLVTGTGTATETATKKSSFARIGKNDKEVPDWGKVTVKSVTVNDKFGREKNVRWSIVGGAGTSRPTIKITPALENGEYVSVELETSKNGDFGYVGLHLY
jgi:hypothetical protein